MNRRVTFVTALSVAGTAAVAALSFAIVYEPADDPSAGVPLLDTTLAVSPDASQGTDPAVGGAVVPGAAPLPTSLDAAVPIAAVPIAPSGSTAPPAASTTASSGQGGRPGSGSAPTATAAPAAAPSGATTPAAPAAPAAPATTVVATGGTHPPATTAAPSAPPTTAAPAATTATTAPAPATTAAARPEGVPADWPANKPIPPMPAGCVQPQLEDNGVWNCQR